MTKILDELGSTVLDSLDILYQGLWFTNTSVDKILSWNVYSYWNVHAILEMFSYNMWQPGNVSDANESATWLLEGVQFLLWDL